MMQAGPSTRFLNVDVAIGGGPEVAALLAALGDRVVALHASETAAVFELGEQHASAETCLQALAAMVEGLSRSERTLWDGLRRRTADIGIQAEARPHEAHVPVFPGTLARLAAIGCGLALTIYAPPAP